MKEFLKVFKDPYVLFPIYLLKSTVWSFGMIDFWILFIVAFLSLAEKFLVKLEKATDQYFDIKNKVISENEFRNAVNQDMANIKQDMAVMKMSVNKPYENLLKR